MNKIDKFGYSGYVNISTTQNKAKVKNAGTETLFELFARLLAGYTVNSAELPRSIMLYAKSIERTTPALNQSIPVTSSFRRIKNQPCAVFTAAISDTNLQNLLPADEYKYYLELRDGTINNVALASIPVERVILEQVQSGRQALIEWVMQVSNTTTVEEV